MEDVAALVHAAAREYCGSLCRTLARVYAPCTIAAAMDCATELALTRRLPAEHVVGPCGRWLLQRTTHQTDAARLVLGTDFQACHVRWLRRDEGRAFYTELVARAPHGADVSRVYRVAAAAGSTLPVLLHAALLKYLRAGGVVAETDAAGQDCPICMEVVRGRQSFGVCARVPPRLSGAVARRHVPRLQGATPSFGGPVPSRCPRGGNSCAAGGQRVSSVYGCHD
jgi:hypothetical protein